MLTIRLQRVGRKNDPSYRVIVVESARAAKTGNFLELVGSYDPRSDRIELKKDRITHWISKGATTSDTVHNLLVSQKVIEGTKINVLPRKSPIKKEEKAEGQQAAPEAAPEAAPKEEKAVESVEAEEAKEAPAEKEGDNAVAEEKASS